MIGISTQNYDLIGARIFRRTDIETELSNSAGKRRLSRTATLDGGASIYDTGYTDSDRDMTVIEPGAEIDAIEFARYIVETYGLINVASRDGFYLGVPESYRMDGGNLEMKILITERLSE